MGNQRRFVFCKNMVLRLAAIVLPAVMVLSIVRQTAFAKTYVITDGDQVLTHTTFATDPEQILGEAGLELEGWDTYITDGDAAINVHRTDIVNISYRGEKLRTSASGETVEELLAQLGLTVAKNDVLSHSLDTRVFDRMELRIDAVVSREETYTAVLKRETTVCNDASIPAGSTEILVEGRDGEVLRRANVTYINGVEVEREILGEDVTIQPVTRIVAVGTGEAPETIDPEGMPTIGDGYIILPTGEVLTYTKTDTVRATAYTHTDAGCDRITATGSVVHKGTVAVDPRFVPYGTRMFIVANDGSFVYGVAEAEDCGGAIKRDRMDLYFPTYEECIAFGWRTCTVYFLG